MNKYNEFDYEDWFRPYISFIENSLSKNINNKIWNIVKKSESLLITAIQIKNNNFISNIIAYKILIDPNMKNTKLYKYVVENILENEILGKIKPNNFDTFLMIILNNKDLIINERQKLLLIGEAEKSPNTEYYYNNNLTYDKPIHGYGILDIRYKLLINKNFSLDEKIELLHSLYPDNECKEQVLEELNWLIIKTLNIENVDTFNIYDIEINNIDLETQSLIELAKYIDTILNNKQKKY